MDNYFEQHNTMPGDPQDVQMRNSKEYQNILKFLVQPTMSMPLIYSNFYGDSQSRFTNMTAEEVNQHFEDLQEILPDFDPYAMPAQQVENETIQQQSPSEEVSANSSTNNNELEVPIDNVLPQYEKTLNVNQRNGEPLDLSLNSSSDVQQERSLTRRRSNSASQRRGQVASSHAMNTRSQTRNPPGHIPSDEQIVKKPRYPKSTTRRTYKKRKYSRRSGNTKSSSKIDNSPKDILPIENNPK